MMQPMSILGNIPVWEMAPPPRAMDTVCLNGTLKRTRLFCSMRLPSATEIQSSTWVFARPQTSDPGHYAPFLTLSEVQVAWLTWAMKPRKIKSCSLWNSTPWIASGSPTIRQMCMCATQSYSHGAFLDTAKSHVASVCDDIYPPRSAPWTWSSLVDISREKDTMPALFESRSRRPRNTVVRRKLGRPIELIP